MANLSNLQERTIAGDVSREGWPREGGPVEATPPNAATVWRRILPTFGPLDLSPVVGVLFLYIVLGVLNNILDRF